MEKYEVIETEQGTVIKRLSDGAFIPNDSTNADYRKFYEDTNPNLQVVSWE